ncbi:glycosyltransferase family 4 protein [Psychroserpens sp.]
MKKLKVIQLFENYGDLYQPYIPPVMDALKVIPNFNIQVDAFTGEVSDEVNVIPNYYKRKIKERVFSLANKSSVKLNYIENKYLKNNVDIIHLQHSYLHKKVKSLLSLPKKERPKVVITLRGADTYMKPWVDKNWVDFYNNYGQEVDAYITMSEHQKRYMQKWNIPLNKIHVIPISYGNPFEAKPKKANSNCIKLVSAFRMCWEKNIEGNLRTVKELIEKGLPVEYDIFGDGKDACQVLYLIDKYKISHCVKYKGSVKNEELKAAVKASDFYLQLSHSESLGMSVIEAQTYGLPAIVSDSDGLPEVVSHEKTGYCVKPYAIDEAASYIEKLWKSPELYSKFSKAAIKKSQANFSINMEVERLRTLYQSLTTA